MALKDSPENIDQESTVVDISDYVDLDEVRKNTQLMKSEMEMSFLMNSFTEDSRFDIEKFEKLLRSPYGDKFKDILRNYIAINVLHNLSPMLFKGYSTMLQVYKHESGTDISMDSRYIWNFALTALENIEKNVELVIDEIANFCIYIMIDNRMQSVALFYSETVKAYCADIIRNIMESKWGRERILEQLRGFLP